MTRAEIMRFIRVSIHKKQEFTQIEDGEPLVSELSEGVFTVRSTDEGVVQYVRFNNVLYKNILVLATKDKNKTWDEV